MALWLSKVLTQSESLTMTGQTVLQLLLCYRLVLPIKGKNGLVLELLLLPDCTLPLVYSEDTKKWERDGKL